MTLIAALLLTASFVQEDASKRIGELIRQLGAEEFAVREKATEELRKIGKPAEEALRKAVEGDDPEVRERARAVLESFKEADRPRPPAPRRGAPGLPGFRGSSVTIQTINGDSTYRITPGDGSAPFTLHKDKAGAVKLEYADEKGAPKTAEAESLGKFLKDHPELAAKYGISEEGIDCGGTRVTFKGGLQGFPFPRAFRMPREFPLPPGFEPDEGLRADGATFEKVSEALRAQLDLPADQGLVVTRVDPGSPAEGAGLRKNDILLEVDGKKMASIRDVRESLKGSRTATVLRKGKRESLAPSSPRKDF